MSMKDTPETKSKLCLLCDSTATPHTWDQFHTTNGKTWRPEKGHKDYDLHKRLVKLLEL